MRLFRKAVAAVLCGAVLCSCAPASQIDIKKYSHEVPKARYRKMQMVVTSSMSAEVLGQADAFADKVAYLSDGMLQIQVVTGLPDLQHVNDGTIDFALVSNLQMSKSEETFSMFTMPFMFRDPVHMSVALNSQSVLDTLSQRIDEDSVALMAAFYGQSKHLATNQFGLQKLSDFSALNIALRMDNSTKLNVFEALGAQVLPYSQTSLTSLMGTEVSLPGMPEGQTVSINTVEATAHQGEVLLSEKSARYFLKTYHTISPFWLIGNQKTLSSLNEFERAVLQEAVAHMVAGIDSERYQEEQELFAKFEENGMAMVNIRPKLRSDIVGVVYKNYAAGSALYPVPEFFDNGLYELIQSYIK